MENSKSEDKAVWEIYCRVEEYHGMLGAGIVHVKDGQIVRTSKYRFNSSGKITRNLAELLAIRIAIQPLRKRCNADEVTIFTISEYAAHAAGCPTKAKANKALVKAIREIVKEFDDIAFSVGMTDDGGNKAGQAAYQSVRFERFVKHVEVSRYCSK